MHRTRSTQTPMRRFRYGQVMALAASSAALLGAVSSPARAQITILADFGNSITSDPNHVAIENTLNSAVAAFEANISTPITVRMAFGEMNTGLGQSSTFFGNVSYSSFLTQLNSVSSSANDATALSVLNPEGSAVNPVNGNTNINVKTANLRAVGFNAPAPTGQSFDGLSGGQWDGVIQLNTSLTTPGSSGSSNQYSLEAVAEHEMDEVLGLGSALPNLPFSTIFPQDLYRYDNTGVRNFTTSGDNAWFSINGTTDLVQFNQTGGGADYGDWHSSGTVRVQDAFGTVGSSPTLGPAELTALDVIGYNLTPAAAGTPEPGSLALFAGMGLSGAVFALRRRARK